MIALPAARNPRRSRRGGGQVLTPKLTAAARRARLGTVDISDEEFEELFGGLPTGPA
jgi:hypothetical protein